MAVQTDTVVTNTRASTVATVTAGTVNTTASPITLIGKGYSGYSKAIAENYYHILENFADNSPPSNPVEGQHWYDTSTGMKYYNGSSWVPLATGSTTDIVLTRLPTATGVDFTSTGQVNIHTGAAGVDTVVSSMIIIPSSITIGADNEAICSLEVANNTGDIIDRFQLVGLDASTKFFRVDVSGANRITAASETIKLNIIQAVAGGDTLTADIYLLGTTF
jgi:hypothetical protein